MLYYICKVDKDNENKIIKIFKKLKKNSWQTKIYMVKYKCNRHTAYI